MKLGQSKYDTNVESVAMMRRSNAYLNTLRIGGEMTMREYGGYNIVGEDFYKMLEGKIEPPRNCFYKNLELARKRNNKNDRLIVAYMMRTNGIPLHHCFILNGENIIDHSNLRKKNVPAELYFQSQSIIRYVEVSYREEGLCGTMIGRYAQRLESDKDFGLTKIDFEIGDWDDAASKVL